ncbi:MAG: ACP S-malonyltransferase [Methylotenera sp.]|nr:ACP S-malonyltransferase [Methylotenera sp.]
MTTFAFVFPGQGSQSVGMLDAWNDHPVVEATLEEASEALGQDLGQLIHEGPKETLALTIKTQPVMLVAAVAAYRVWMAEGGARPSFVAGHSLGEYSALVASEVLSLSQAVPLVRLRAQAMQEAVAVGAGAMAAVLGLQAAQVVAICAQAQSEFAPDSGEVVQAANFNDPGQTVISGSQQAVEKACELLKAAGAKRTLLLPVSAPFHCAMMEPAAQRLRSHLADLSLGAPQIPVINNIDVAQETDPARIRDALFRQAFGPVRWVETIQRMQQLGVSHVVECGPGKVLSGMVKRISPDLQSHALYDPVTLTETFAFLKT